jgi:hypothetical protein
LFGLQQSQSSQPFSECIYVAAVSGPSDANRDHENDDGIAVDPVDYPVSLAHRPAATVSNQHPAKGAALLIRFIPQSVDTQCQQPTDAPVSNGTQHLFSPTRDFDVVGH